MGRPCPWRGGTCRRRTAAAPRTPSTLARDRSLHAPPLDGFRPATDFVRSVTTGVSDSDRQAQARPVTRPCRHRRCAGRVRVSDWGVSRPRRRRAVGEACRDARRKATKRHDEAGGHRSPQWAPGISPTVGPAFRQDPWAGGGRGDRTHNPRGRPEDLGRRDSGDSEPAVGGSRPALVTLFLVASSPACASRCRR